MKRLKEKLEGKALTVVMATLFLDVLGVGILIPVLPQLVYQIFIPAGYTQNEAFIMLGWLTAIFPLMQFLATPVLGQLSDRYGRKPVLSISLFGTGLGYVLFAIAIITKNIPLLFLARALDGVTGGNLSVARAVIADVTPPEKRTKNFALIGAAFGIGFVFGPYIGARLATPNVGFFGLFTTPSWFNAATPFWFTAILSGITTLLVLTILPETHKHINKKLKLAWGQSFQNIKKAATNPALKTVFASEFFYWGGFTFFTTFFQILLIDKLNFTVNNVGDFFAYIGLCIAITQATITPLLAKRFKNYQILKISFFGTAGALFLQLIPHNTTQLLMLAWPIALFNGLTLANSSALVSNSVDAKVQGEVLGIEASVQALAQSIPAAMSGYLATMGIATPVIVGAFTIAFGGLLFLFMYKPPRSVVHLDQGAA